MKPGTKPKPKVLKLLQGEKKKSRINQDEPEPELKIPKCPHWLGGKAKHEWKRITKELDGLGLLTEMDRSALAGYCDAYGRWADASILLKQEGILIRVDDKILRNPVLPVISQALKEMKMFLVEFGMTPSSRTRISVPPKKPKGPFANI